MKSEYVVEVGITSENVVYFDPETKSLLTSDKNFECINVGEILLLNGNLSFLFEFPSGIIIGLSGSIGDLSDLPQKSLKIPTFIDGAVRFKTSVKLIQGAKYVFALDKNIAFDPQNNVLLMGTPNADSLCVRLCKNLYVSVYENTVCSIHIKL